jgi:hypothetical protein
MFIKLEPGMARAEHRLAKLQTPKRSREPSSMHCVVDTVGHRP